MKYMTHDLPFSTMFPTIFLLKESTRLPATNNAATLSDIAEVAMTKSPLPFLLLGGS